MSFERGIQTPAPTPKVRRSEHTPHTRTGLVRLYLIIGISWTRQNISKYLVKQIQIGTKSLMFIKLTFTKHN